MLLSDVSIRRPVFATMMNVVLVVFGLFSLPRLATDQFPNVDFPIVTVSVLYPGADPESIEQRVLKPLEEAVNGISGLEKLMTTAYPNLGQMVLQFQLEKNSDQAAQEVRDRVFAAVGKLPPEAESPVVRKFDMGGAPIVHLALSTTNQGVTFAELSALATDVVKSSLERVQGVASVELAGERTREVQVLVDRKRLASLGLTPQDVIESIRQQNLDLPAGKIESQTQTWSIRLKGRLASGQDISRLPILTAISKRLSVGDVAQVRDDLEDEETAAFINGSPTILLSVLKQGGSSTPTVADGIMEKVAKLAGQLPQGTKLEVVSDNSRFIKGSIDSVKLDLVLGAFLAILIVLLFLRNIPITVISAMALPTAIIATFAFLKSMNFTLNMMSTLGLSLSIGILIDDAIIVIENIHRHMAMGKSGLQAAMDGTQEIGLAVMATTLTICAVFVPVAFMEGIIGRFFYQFGLTVACAVLISLFVAFTLTPMLASRWLGKGHAPHTHTSAPGLWQGLSMRIEHTLSQWDQAYKRLLVWCLNHRKTTLMGGVMLFICSMIMLKFVPITFFPKEDRSQFTVTYNLPEGTAMPTSKIKVAELARRIQSYPGVRLVVSAIGATRERKASMARLNVMLVDVRERDFSQSDLIQRLRKDLADMQGPHTELLITESGNEGGGGKSQPIQFIFRSEHWPSLVEFSEKARAFTSDHILGAVDVSTSRPKIRKEIQIHIDPLRSADVGLSPAQVGMTIRALYEGGKVNDIQDKGKTFDINLRIADQDRVGIEDVASVALTNRLGQSISLSSIADITEGEAPSVIERYDGQRQITLLANFTGKDLNKAVQDIDAFIQKNLPPEVTVSMSGQAETMKQAMKAMLKALGLALLLVFMILCAQYERYLAPLVIMAALPLSLTGAFGSLLITGQVMSVYTMIGIILLMGVVTKNGILLVDFALERIQAGLSVKDALLEAGPIRLRPILMTTFAAGGGMLPVAIGHGVGGDARSPMGVAVIGGLLMSTLLTLVIVPCLFSVVEEWRQGKKT